MIKIVYLIGLLIISTFIVGCTKTAYVCSDQSIVSDLGTCKRATDNNILEGAVFTDCNKACTPGLLVAGDRVPVYNHKDCFVRCNQVGCWEYYDCINPR
jgi:hypothetical protein